MSELKPCHFCKEPMSLSEFGQYFRLQCKNKLCLILPNISNYQYNKERTVEVWNGIRTTDAEIETYRVANRQANGHIEELSNELKARHAELERLRDWKESALKQLSEWHTLGEILQKYTPLVIGDNIPARLSGSIPSELARLKGQLERLRKALAELVGAESLEDLTAMECVLRSVNGIDRDKVAALNAIHALQDLARETLAAMKP